MVGVTLPRGTTYIIKSNDAHLTMMNVSPLRRVKEHLTFATGGDEANGNGRPRYYDSLALSGKIGNVLGDFDYTHSTFWCSVMPKGNTTGFLRPHTLRMNSITLCQRIDLQDMPESRRPSRPRSRVISVVG